MSVRQYIGARYVTKIYENSIDPSSAEWEGGRAYEPLTLVTYLNSSYLSKKEVPASVGDPAANPTYWVITGAYNGQIATLQSQIDAINATISDMNKPMKLLCIGDSYGIKIANNWANYLKTWLDLDNDHFTNKCTGNAGFIGNTGYKTFLEQLQEPSDKDTYTHIVIVGGLNDAYDANGNIQSNPDMLSAINACGTYIKANYPNAKVFLGNPANACNLNDPATAAVMRPQIAQMRNVYSFYGAQQGWCIMKDIQNCMHDLAYMNELDITYGCVFHPNAAGGENIARCILSYMNGGDFTIGRLINVGFTSPSGVTITGILYESQFDDHIAILTRNNMTVEFSSPVTYATATSLIQIMDSVGHKIVYPNNDDTLSTTVKVRVKYSDSTSSYGTALITFKGNTASIWCVPPMDESKTISQVVFFPFSINSTIQFN